MTLQEYHIWKSMPRVMLGRNRVPPAMLYCDSRLIADTFEAHLHLRNLIRTETLVPLRERQPRPRLPYGNPPDLEYAAIR
jgi:hypothetical protein